MNIYHIGNEIYRFNIFNLIADDMGFGGQYRVYWHRDSEKYVMGRFGGFGSLTHFPKTEVQLMVPSEKQDKFIRPVINKRLRGAFFYDGNKSCGQGDFLMRDLDKREKAGEYVRWMKMWNVFQKDMAFEEDNCVDEEAVKMF